MKTNTAKIKKYYRQIGTAGMSKLMKKDRDVAYINFLKKHLNKKMHILDLACGYGRLTIPLAKFGYNIEGTDLAPNFIRDAKRFAKQNKLKIKFKIGNMLKLPYRNEAFDTIICMWSSFNHFLNISDQKKSTR